MRRPRLALGLSLALAGAPLSLMISPGTASAQTAKKPGAKDKDKDKDPSLAEAKKLFDQGSDAYRDGRYEEAIKAWDKSYELSHKPLIFESIANAYERLGDKKKAREYLARWRAEAPKAEQEQLDERIKNLDARIAASEAEDARKAEEDRKKAAQGRKDQGSKDGDDGRSKRFYVAIGAAGAGVLAVGAGIVLDAVAAGKRPDSSKVCASDGTKTYCQASAKGAIESSSTLALAGDITWIAGVVLVGAGVALYVTMPDAKASGKDSAPAAQKQSSVPPRWVSIAPMVGPTGGGVGIRGAF